MLNEVALPLEATNKQSPRENSTKQGHPSTLRLWRARRPLATGPAVLFAQLVDDPSETPWDTAMKLRDAANRMSTHTPSVAWVGGRVAPFIQLP